MDSVTKSDYNINGRDVQRKHVVNNVDKSDWFMGTMTKWPVQKHRTLQNTEYTKTQQTLRNSFFVCFRIFFQFLIT